MKVYFTNIIFSLYVSIHHCYLMKTLNHFNKRFHNKNILLINSEPNLNLNSNLNPDEKPNENSNSDDLQLYFNSNKIKHPFSKKYYEHYLKRLNSKNITIQNNYIIGGSNYDELNENYYYNRDNNNNDSMLPLPKYRIIINKNHLAGLGLQITNNDNFESDENPFGNVNEEDNTFNKQVSYGNRNSNSDKEKIRSKIRINGIHY